MKKYTVATVLYDHFAPLDAFGPLQMFGTTGGRFDAFTIGLEPGIAHAGSDLGGVPVQILHSFQDEVEYDIVMVPGADNSVIQQLLDNADFMSGLKGLCEKADIIASVCTGAALVAATGLVDGQDMTTNKMSYSWIASQFPNINWNCEPRWINRINPDTQKGLISSGGVSAGTDMSLGLIETLFDAEVVTCTEEITEYNWNSNPAVDHFAYLCSGRRKCKS